MAIVREEVTPFTDSAAAATSRAFALAGGATAGNLLISRIGIDKAAGSNPAPAPLHASDPTQGWVVLDTHASTSVSGAMAFRIATGTSADICTWSWTTSRESCGWIAEYSGFPNGVVLPVPVAFVHTNESNVSSVALSGISAIGDALAVASGAVDSGNGWAPTWSNSFTAFVTTGDDGAAFAADKIVTAGAVSTTMTRVGGSADQASGILANFGVAPASDIDGDLEQGQETDSAGSLTPDPGAVDIELEQGQEVDSAGEMTPEVETPSGTLEQASETDAPGEMSPEPGAVGQDLGQAGETDEAGELTPDTTVDVELQQAGETDTGGAFTPSPGAVDGELEQAGEADAAGGFSGTAAPPPPSVAIDYTGDRFLWALARPHEVVVRATLLDGGTETELPTVVDGSVSLNANAATRGSCELSIADDGTLGWIPTSSDSPLAPYGREVRIERGIRYYDGTTEFAPLGVFRIEDAGIDDSGSEIVVAISGLDRSARIIDAKFEEPYQIAAGTNYVDAILETIQAAWPDVPHDLPTTEYAAPAGGLPKEEGADRWQFCQEMAAACGMELYFDSLGVLVMRPVAQFVTGTAAWHLVEGEDGVLIRAGLQWSRQNSFNKSIVTGENIGDDGPPARGVAVDDNPLSPTYYHGPFGKVPDFYSSTEIISDAQAADVAAARLARQLGTTQSISFGAIVNPKLEPSQVVRVSRERAGIDQEDHVIDTLNLPLSSESEMTGATRATVVI